MEFTSETKMMKRATPQTYRNEQGQTMTEFAMVLPILLLVLFAVIQLGIVFNNYVTVTDAARAGARKAVVSRQAADRRRASPVTAVRNSAANLDQSKLGVTVSSTWRRARTSPSRPPIRTGQPARARREERGHSAARQRSDSNDQLSHAAAQDPKPDRQLSSCVLFLVVLICMMAAVLDVGSGCAPTASCSPTPTRPRSRPRRSSPTTPAWPSPRRSSTATKNGGSDHGRRTSRSRRR